MVLELVPMSDLHQVLASPAGKALSMKWRLKVAIDCASGLKYAHPTSCNNFFLPSPSPLLFAFSFFSFFEVNLSFFAGIYIPNSLQFAIVISVHQTYSYVCSPFLLFPLQTNTFSFSLSFSSLISVFFFLSFFFFWYLDFNI